MTSCDSSALTSSCFYKEVQTIPLLQSIGHLYTSTKSSSRVLNTGLAVVEYSVSSVWCRVLAGSSIVSHVDSMAGEGMTKLKEKYPSLQTTSEEIRSSASHAMKLTVRGAMKTGPGQVILNGLDWVLDTSEGILKRVRPQDKSPRKCKLSRPSLQKEVLLATKETSYASEDSGACDADGESTNVHKSQQTMPTVKDKKPWSRCIVNKAYIMGIFFPLEFLVEVLKSVRRYAGGRRHKPALRSPITPEKEVEIGSRRKVSPRKKVTSSFLGIIKERTYRILGYQHVRAVDLGQAHDGSSQSPDREETENKRKHDEILTDDGSSTDENLANFDLDDYDSAEDPDYEPNSADESEDSISDGVAESDMETELIKIDPVLIQIKEKPKDAALPMKQEPKTASPVRMPVDKAADIPMKPTTKCQLYSESTAVNKGVVIQLKPDKKPSPPKGPPTNQGNVSEIKPEPQRKYSPKSIPLEKGVELQLKPERKQSPNRKSVEKGVKIQQKQERKTLLPIVTPVDQGDGIKLKPEWQNRH